jgi:hypothetical protein
MDSRTATEQTVNRLRRTALELVVNRRRRADFETVHSVFALDRAVQTMHSPVGTLTSDDDLSPDMDTSAAVMDVRASDT